MLLPARDCNPVASAGTLKFINTRDAPPRVSPISLSLSLSLPRFFFFFFFVRYFIAPQVHDCYGFVIARVPHLFAYPDILARLGGGGAVAANKFIDRSDKIEATLNSVSSAHSELLSRAASR